MKMSNEDLYTNLNKYSSNLSLEMENSYNTNTCLYCKKYVTKWQDFLGFFWKFMIRITEVSMIWEYCCSYKCYGKQLEKMIKESKKELKLQAKLL